MNSKPHPTPRPWKNLRAGGVPVGLIADDVNGKSWDVTDDAAYIVKAVNAHEELVRALKTILECDRSTGDAMLCDACQNQAKKALAQATEVVK